MLLTGRISGISGIIYKIICPESTNRLWPMVYIVGLITGGLIIDYFFPNLHTKRFNTPLVYLALAGFLVGFGTRMGNGCTSGHSICGISRFSMRSLVATLTYISAGVISLYFTKLLF